MIQGAQSAPGFDRVPGERPLRIAYVSGPTDAVSIYDNLVNASRQSYFGTNYLEKFMKLMIEVGAITWIETWNAYEENCVERGRFVFYNDPPEVKGGWRYQLRQIISQSKLLIRVFKFKPDIFILTGQQEYWWMYSPLRFRGAKFVATIHGALWTPYHPLRPHQKVFRKFNALLAYPCLDAAVVASQVIRRQLLEELGPRGNSLAVFEHLPNYSSAQFAGLESPACLPRTTLEVFFSGRITANKGAFDLIEMAARLKDSRPGEFRFHMCGDGPDLEAVRAAIFKRGLSHVIESHGYCMPEQMRAVMNRCHVVIVPTRSDVPAGFEMTCAEAILSHRPLIASPVCPALEYLQQASIEVQPDDIDGYVKAIEQLKDDENLFRRLVGACEGLTAQFYDIEQSWDRAMRNALVRVGAMAPSRGRRADQSA